MGGTKGYRSYRGRTSKGKIALAVLLVLIILAAVGFLWLQEYIVYDADGNARLDLPWRQEASVPPAEEEDPLQNVEITVQEPEAPPPTRDAKAGDTVELVSMGTKATVLSVNKDGSLQLQAGILKISAKQSEVRVVEGETQSQKDVRKIIQRAERTLRSAAPREVDLRGMTTDEALVTLENFLDTAMLGKLETVTVIHGKGTGAVRKAVHTYLKRCKGVASFRLGRFGEGEDGVTIVDLK